MSGAGQTPAQSIADEFHAELVSPDEASLGEHALVSDLKAILEGPDGGTIGSLARVVEQLLGELSIGRAAIFGAGAGYADVELSAEQVIDLGNTLLEIERQRADE